MPGGVTIIETNVDRVGLTSWNQVNGRTNTFHISKVSDGWNILTSGWGFGWIHGIDVEILVPAFVLDVQNKPGVARPKVGANRASGIGGNRLRVRKRLGGLFHPDIPCPLERFDKGDKRTVWRDLRARNFRIAKEEITINQGWLLGPRLSCQRE